MCTAQIGHRRVKVQCEGEADGRRSRYGGCKTWWVVHEERARTRNILEKENKRNRTKNRYPQVRHGILNAIRATWRFEWGQVPKVSHRRVLSAFLFPVMLGQVHKRRQGSSLARSVPITSFHRSHIHNLPLNGGGFCVGEQGTPPRIAGPRSQDSGQRTADSPGCCRREDCGTLQTTRWLLIPTSQSSMVSAGCESQLPAAPARAEFVPQSDLRRIVVSSWNRCLIAGSKPCSPGEDPARVGSSTRWFRILFRWLIPSRTKKEKARNTQDDLGEIWNM